MGVDSFKVVFNNPKRIYFNGDTLTVRIVIASDSGFKLNEITCRLQGRARTKWNEKRGNTRYYYQGTEKYFDTKIILFKKPQVEAFELPPGEFSYQFSFQIPHGIPPSLRGDTGKVEYRVCVTMDRPWKFDETLNEPFIVQSMFDLNKYISLREPAGTIMEHDFCCCFNSGQISAIVRVPYKGYIVGQNIPVTVQINNVSTCDINDIRVKLRRYDTFYTVGRTHKTGTKEIVKAEQSLGVKVKSRNAYAFCFNYLVPNVPIVNMMECGIIDIKYTLRFELVLSGLTCNMHGELPLYIGSSPFDNVQSPDEPPPYELLELRP